MICSSCETESKDAEDFMKIKFELKDVKGIQLCWEMFYCKGCFKKRKPQIERVMKKIKLIKKIINTRKATP